MTNENTEFRHKLTAARDNVRFADKRIAALEVECAAAMQTWCTAMSNVKGLRAPVQGDLAPEIMPSVADAVRRTVLDHVAQLDIASPLHAGRRSSRIWPCSNLG